MFSKNAGDSVTENDRGWAHPCDILNQNSKCSAKMGHG